MSSALYNAMSAALAQGRAVDVTANNVANASTPGFRAQRVTFQEVLGQQSPQVELGATVPDVSHGEIEATGNPLDLAIHGRGYFTLQGNNGEVFTRDGSFRVNEEGMLVNRDGLPVQGQEGLLYVPPDAKSLAVGADGTVTADGRQVGTVRVANVSQQGLLSEGAYLRARPDAPVDTLEEPSIQSGALEGANFDVVRGMVDLIRSSRTFEAANRTIQTVSEIERRVARGFGNGG